MAPRAPTMMAAQAKANEPELIEVSTILPSTSEDPPKYSPTSAPMNANVVLTLSAVNRNGSMFGTRTLSRISASLAAYERISSNADGWTWTRPRVTLMTTGKNTSNAAINALDVGLRMPNQLLMMGAI